MAGENRTEEAGKVKKTGERKTAAETPEETQAAGAPKGAAEAPEEIQAAGAPKGAVEAPEETQAVGAPKGAVEAPEEIQAVGAPKGAAGRQGKKPSGKNSAADFQEGYSAEKLCCEKRKHRDKAEFSDLIHRLNRVEGQIRGIRSMVENDAYCIDIITQVSAAGAALNAFSRALLDSHVRTCVVEDIRGGSNEKTEELLAVLQKFMR